MDTKAITDAPNLRASYRNMCGNCAYFKWISDGDGACSKFEASVEEEFVCDAWEKIVLEPLPVVVVEAPEVMSISADTLVSFGQAVKALGDGKVGGYLVRFSTENDPDLTDDFFRKSTEFGVLDGGSLPVYYQHGMDETLGVKRIGRGTVKVDDVGLWMESQLEMRDEYERAIYELAKSGKLGYSSGAAPHLVEREQVGKAWFIKSWPIAEASLTPTPAEPRNSVMPIKSLIPAHAVDTEAEAKAIEPNKEQHMDTEIKALFDGLKEDIKQIAADAAQKAVNDLPEIKTARAVEVVTDEADRPFTTMAEQASAIKAWTVTSGQRADPRLSRLTAWSKAALGANEGTPSEGGFMLEPTLTGEFLKPMHEAGAFTSMVRRLPVSNNSNYGWINGVDETSRADGSRWGGVLGYWLAEAGTKTASQPKFRRINWELKKVIAAMYATDELLADAAQFSAVANQSAGEEIDFQVNDALLNGNGVGKPLGVLQSGALVSVGRVAASAIGHADILNMWQRLSPRSRANSVWFVNSDSEPQLDALYFATGSNGVLSPYVSYDQTGVMRLKGRPVMVTEFSPSLGSAGDVLLADMSQYLFWEKGGVQSASSIHVQFLTDQTVFRFVYRCDGQTADYSPVTPYKGSNTQSAFVALAATTG